MKTKNKIGAILLIAHDNLDGLVSQYLMKEYLVFGRKIQTSAIQYKPTDYNNLISVIAAIDDGDFEEIFILDIKVKPQVIEKFVTTKVTVIDHHEFSQDTALDERYINDVTRCTAKLINDNFIKGNLIDDYSFIVSAVNAFDLRDFNKDTRLFALGGFLGEIVYASPIINLDIKRSFLFSFFDAIISEGLDETIEIPASYLEDFYLQFVRDYNLNIEDLEQENGKKKIHYSSRQKLMLLEYGKFNSHLINSNGHAEPIYFFREEGKAPIDIKVIICTMKQANFDYLSNIFLARERNANTVLINCSMEVGVGAIRSNNGLARILVNALEFGSNISDNTASFHYITGFNITRRIKTYIEKLNSESKNSSQLMRTLEN